MNLGLRSLAVPVILPDATLIAAAAAAICVNAFPVKLLTVFLHREIDLSYYYIDHTWTPAYQYLTLFPNHLIYQFLDTNTADAGVDRVAL